MILENTSNSGAKFSWTIGNEAPYLNCSSLTDRSRSPPGLSPNAAPAAAVISSAAAGAGAPAALVPPIFTIAEDDDDDLIADRVDIR